MGNPNNFPCNKRIDELDFMKFVFIVLMIAFHLTYISSLYPELKRFVYTFHMPAFLVISGFVMNIQKTPRKFARTMWWLFVPYVVMESGYILMASALPIKEHIAHLTPPRLCPMPCRASLRPLLVSANAYSVWLHLLWHFRHNASPSNCNQNTDDMGFLLHFFKTGNSFALLRMLLSCRCGNKTTWLQAPQNIGPIMVGSCWDGNNSIRCDPL